MEQLLDPGPAVLEAARAKGPPERCFLMFETQPFCRPGRPAGTGARLVSNLLRLLWQSGKQPFRWKSLGHEGGQRRERTPP